MRNIIILAFLITSVFAKAQVKNGVVVYKKQMIQRTFTKELAKKMNPEQYKEYKDLEDQVIEALKNIDFELKFNNYESYFKYVDQLKHDINDNFELALGPYGSSTYYSNLSTNEFLEKRNVFGEDFLIFKNKLDWELTKESKKIGGYICYKALTKIKRIHRGKEKEYTKSAWYCPSINMQHGPLGYGGLPGLILELNDGNYTYRAVEIRLNSLKGDIEKKPKGKKISQVKMNAMISEAMGNFKKNKGY